MRLPVKKIVRALAIATTLALAPVAYSSDRGLHENAAVCQNYTCCLEMGSLCHTGTHVYTNAAWKNEGPCHPIRIKPST